MDTRDGGQSKALSCGRRAAGATVRLQVRLHQEISQ